MKIDITSPDGVCPAYFHTPEGDGKWPGVIVLMDGPGMRPAVLELAVRLAHTGFAVLTPDLFYRSGPYDPIDPRVVFTNPELREAHRARFMALATPGAVMTDMAAFLDWLDARPEVQEGRVGVTGYCMGGRLALIAAGTYPDRIGAAASYHGGGLANDTATSPHLLAPRIRARVYVAGAIEDKNFDDAQRERLEKALTDAEVDHVVETYPARHGWVLRDTPVHDPVEAEHHWATLVPFLKSSLTV